MGRVARIYKTIVGQDLTMDSTIVLFIPWTHMRPQTLPPLSFDPALLAKALRLGIDQGWAKLLSATYSFKPGDGQPQTTRYKNRLISIQRAYISYNTLL